jgi:hypothetical protein
MSYKQRWLRKHEGESKGSSDELQVLVAQHLAYGPANVHNWRLLAICCLALTL